MHRRRVEQQDVGENGDTSSELREQVLRRIRLVMGCAPMEDARCGVSAVALRARGHGTRMWSVRAIREFGSGRAHGPCSEVGA